MLPENGTEKQRISLADQLQAIPPVLPALMRAQKVSKKMNTDADLSHLALIKSVVTTLENLSDSKELAEQKQLLGDTLFRLTTLCRRMGIEAEEALTATIEKAIASVE